MAPKAATKSHKSARHLIALLHGWIGVCASVFIFLIAATGVALAFFNELFELQYGDMVRASDGPPSDIAAILASAEQSRPDVQVMGFMGPDTRVSGLETALVFGPSEDRFLMISVDPSTAEYKGVFDLERAFAHELNDFHFSLLLGDAAQTFMAIIGVLLIAFLLTGLFMWWPRGTSSAAKKLVRVQMKGRWLPKLFNWHGLAGVWLGLFTLLFAVTGIGLSKPDWLGPLTAQIDEPADWDARFKQDCGDRLSMADAAQVALGAFPGHTVTAIFVVTGEEEKYIVNLRDEGDWNVRFGDAYAEVHARCDGEIWSTTLGQQDPKTVFGTLMLTLHGGHIFGAMQEVITVITGLALMLISGSGVVVFFKRTLPARTVRRRQTMAVQPRL